jgi:hypothetical protein
MDLATVRTPTVPLPRGFYESTYLVATDPAGGRALWLRDTWLKAPGAAAEPLTWVTWWGPELTQARGRGTGTLYDGGLDQHVWQLSVEPTAEPVPYLPRWAYDRPFPRSNGVALVPHGTVSGTFDGTPIDGWHAMVGHNWGSEHAAEWTWTHGAGTDGTWFDQVRVKPLKRGPWVTVATVHVDGRTTTSRRPLDLTVTPREEVHWDYASPSGHARAVRNCSVSDAVLVHHGRTYTFPGTVAAEVGA